MRTVTFSDEAVSDLIGANFVSVWKNIRPSQKFQDGIYRQWGKNFAEQLPEGVGETNVCTIVATPKGEILYALQGHYKKKRFIQELQFAIKLAEANQEAGTDGLKKLYTARIKKIERGRRVEQLLQQNIRFLQTKPLLNLSDIKERTNAGLSGR